MKKFILFTLISILFLVTPLSNVSASTIYHVNHNSTGCWRASYDVTVSKNNIINVSNLSIQTSIGTYNKVIKSTRNSFTLIIVRHIGGLIFNTGLKTVIVNGIPKTNTF